MPNITVVGNSAAGFSACETLLKDSSGSLNITLISEEPYPAYKRNLLVDYLRGSIKEEELFLCGEDYYKNNNISFHGGAVVTRIDTKRRRVVLKDNSRVEYDWLIVASGRKIEFPDIPGKGKDGVAAFYSLDDIKQVQAKLMVSQTVCIIGDTPICLSLAEVISSKDKDVKIISKSGLPVPAQASNTAIELLNGFEPAECIGEGEVQALKLSNGKVIGTSLVLFTDNYMPSTDFLKESDVKTSEGYVIVDDMSRTNIESVFACGSVCRKADTAAGYKSWDEALNEGVLAAQSVLAGII